MAYIQLHQSLGHHRKTLRMVAMLRCNRHKLLGHLDELWWWGLDNANPQGELGHVAPEDIAGAAGWPVKDAPRFVQALLECGGNGKPGFLEQHAGEGFVLHDWPEYAGRLNESRALRRESNRRAQSARRQRLRDADSQQSQHPSVPERSVSKPSVPGSPPLPPHDVSADALNSNGVAACCAQFKISQRFHAVSCSNYAEAQAS